jgi:hypothetical protein
MESVMETWQLVAVSASAGWALAHLGNLLHLRMMAW